MDKTTFWWVSLCSICHPGGGPGEYDRDGQLLYDYQTGQFGYEKLGKTAAEVVYDGDYSVVSNKNGDIKNAPWNVTGLLEPDCLSCHRTDRAVNGSKNMNWVWRSATLRGRESLVDSQGGPMAAYKAAPTIGQGWLANLVLKSVPAGKPPMAASVDVNYQAGIDDGSLGVGAANELELDGGQISRAPKDYACWGCHATADLKKRGRTWFDPGRDVHYAAFNNLGPGDDPATAIQPGDSQVCTACHGAGMDHSFAKGNANLGSVDNARDFENFRECRDCHDQSDDNPLRDPNATAMPRGDTYHMDRHLGVLSCQACHIPYKQAEASFAVDNATTGSTINYQSKEFLSADPLDPTNPDKSRWHPSLRMRKGRDGKERLYPIKLLLSVWWGDWNQNGTPADLSDDVVVPLALWRVRGMTTGATLPGVTDDNGDGKPEVNRPDEILTYITALRGTDKYGVPLAANPALVKGGRVWYEDPANPGKILHVDYHGTGMKVESSHPFSVDHNVLPASEAWGAGATCSDCHFSRQTPVFDQKVLVDPFGDGPAATPVYKTIRELTGVSPD